MRRGSIVSARNIALDNSRPEEFAQPLYDRVNIATTVPSSISLFTNPIGSTVTLIRGSAAASAAKTRVHTNMEQAGFIATRAYQVNGLAIGIVHSDRDAATNAEDRDYIVDGAYLKFTLAGSKTILEIPLIALPIVNDFQSIITTATATTINALNGPKGSMYKLNPSITLPQSTNFAVTMDWDVSTAITLSNTADIYLLMFAGMRRPT